VNSRFLRVQFRNTILGIAVEYAICLAVSFAFNDSGQFTYAFMILFAVWAVQILIWLKKTIASTAAYYLFGKREFSGEILAALHHNNFPIYDNFAPDAYEYLLRVLKDEGATREQLTYAASIGGQIDLLRSIGPIAAWRMMSCVETALDSYRQRK
jgi:hypothetical protein